ncbi:MAG TPA: slipin family protein [Polyangiaceae bacterium]|nr:slipin family protein [Polyangiaceae bacterium]
MKTLQVNLNERLVVLQRGLPTLALSPGRHTLWGWNIAELRFCTDELLFTAGPEVRAVMPSEWFEEVRLTAHERAILYRDDLPVRYLRPGVHRYWTVDEGTRLRRFDVNEAVPSLSAEELRIIAAGDLLEVTVSLNERGLLLQNGRYQASLQPGQFRFWQTSELRTQVHLIDMRRRNLTLAGQELMTKDKVTLRLTVSVEYAVADERRVWEQLSNIEASVYQAAQLALRDYVSVVTLDHLLEGRSELSNYLESTVSGRLGDVGLRLASIGLKDVILPGEMKALLNRVIEAEKEAAANVIFRREEVAATRSLANTAKLMAEQPILLRLKELDALRDIAERIQEVRVVVGADGLNALLPANLLGQSNASRSKTQAPQ